MAIDEGFSYVVRDVAASLNIVRSMRDKLPALLEGIPLDKKQLEDLSLAVTEHITNLVKHGEGVNLSVAIRHNSAALLLIDDGSCIKDALKSAPSMDALLSSQPLSEHGMGLTLINTLFPDAEYGSSLISETSLNYLLLPLAAVEKPSIAIIDDDLSQLVMLESFLEDRFDVQLFSDPQEALSSLPEMDLQLIISDIKMPSMTGLELREKLLAYPSVRLVPFIFLSGSGDDEIHEKASHLLIDDFISKPVVKKNLDRTILRIMNRSVHLKQTLDAELDKNITHSLWNQLPPTAGKYRLDCAYEVASRGGGDFVFSARRSNSLLIILGDIMGHGEQAKFFAYAIAGYLHGLCLSQANNQTVESILTGLSQVMFHSEVLQNTLVTCLAIEIFDDGPLQIASAGHPAPWLINRLGEIQEIEVGGMLPGVSEETDYKSVFLSLDQGQGLLAYTDGLLEDLLGLRGGNIEAMESGKFASAVSSQWASPASGLLAGLMHQDSSLKDDVTLISVVRD